MTVWHIRISRMQLSVVSRLARARRRGNETTVWHIRISRLSRRRDVTVVCRLPSRPRSGDELSDRWAPDELAARPSCAGLVVVFGRMAVWHRRIYIYLVAPPPLEMYYRPRAAGDGGCVRGRCGCRSSTSAAARPRPRRRAACRAGPTAARRSTGATGDRWLLRSVWQRGTARIACPPQPRRRNGHGRPAARRAPHSCPPGVVAALVAALDGVATAAQHGSAVERDAAIEVAAPPHRAVISRGPKGRIASLHTDEASLIGRPPRSRSRRTGSWRCAT